MRTICCGDTHGRSFWKLIKETEKWDRFIFIGDYFDSFDIPGVVQIQNFNEICDFKKNSDKEIIMLIGNHDHHYFPEIGYSGTSGYQSLIHHDLEYVITQNRNLLQMSYALEEILFSHAGIGESWIERCSTAEGVSKYLKPYISFDIAKWVNSLFQYKPLLFSFTGRDPYGDDMGQTPVWIRPRSLMRDSQEMKKAGIIQVVGHTGQRKIDIEGKATGGKYFFIDTLGTSGEYLIIEDGKFSTGNVNS